MALTKPTAADVRAIIPLPAALADATINAMIDAAAVLVAPCSAIEARATTEQAEILKWVAAHLLSLGHASRSGPVTARSMGDASETYGGLSLLAGKGLGSTFYGQTAITLDPSGCLERLGKIKARMRVL